MLKNLSKLERANVLTHAPGALFGMVGLPMLQWLGGSWATLVFSLTFIFMMSASSIYHWHVNEDKKRKWRVVDHISIYCLIAGTYTAFIIEFMNNSRGVLILEILWGCVLVGSILKIFFTGRFKVVSTIIYLIMGWMAIFAIGDFLELIPTQILIWIGIGGVFYTVGTLFYLWKRYEYHHAIWHLFVLGGALSHWYGVYLSVQ